MLRRSQTISRRSASFESSRSRDEYPRQEFLKELPLLRVSLWFHGFSTSLELFLCVVGLLNQCRLHCLSLILCRERRILMASSLAWL